MRNGDGMYLKGNGDECLLIRFGDEPEGEPLAKKEPEMRTDWHV